MSLRLGQGTLGTEQAVHHDAGFIELDHSSACFSAELARLFCFLYLLDIVFLECFILFLDRCQFHLQLGNHFCLLEDLFLLGTVLSSQAVYLDLQFAGGFFNCLQLTLCGLKFFGRLHPFTHGHLQGSFKMVVNLLL